MVEPKFLLVSTTNRQERRNQTNFPNIWSGSSIEDTKSQSTTYSLNFPSFLLVQHTHTHTSKKERRKKQTQIPKHSKWQLKIHLIFFHFQQNYLIYKDAEKTQCTGQAAICPLHQKEEQVCGRTIRQPHLQACSIVVSRKLGSSATQ